MNIRRNFKITIAAVIVFALALAAAPSAALAQDAAGGEYAAQSLELRYKQAGLAVQMFQLRISMTNLIAAKAQTLIDKAAAEGKDTSVLASALSTFKSQISAAQSAHDSAAAILASHAGFDDSGTVTDEETARATITSVRETLREGRANFREGAREFRHTFREWRRANKPQEQSDAP